MCKRRKERSNEIIKAHLATSDSSIERWEGKREMLARPRLVDEFFQTRQSISACNAARSPTRMQEANWSERKKDVRGRHSANISIVSGRPSRFLSRSLYLCWVSDSLAWRDKHACAYRWHASANASGLRNQKLVNINREASGKRDCPPILGRCEYLE